MSNISPSNSSLTYLYQTIVNITWPVFGKFVKNHHSVAELFRCPPGLGGLHWPTSPWIRRGHQFNHAKKPYESWGYPIFCESIFDELKHMNTWIKSSHSCHDFNPLVYYVPATPAVTSCLDPGFSCFCTWLCLAMGPCVALATLGQSWSKGNQERRNSPPPTGANWEVVYWEIGLIG